MFKILLLGLSILFLQNCTKNIMYHSDIDGLGILKEGKFDSADKNATIYINSDKRISLSIIELDEQGQLFKRKQLDKVMQHIKSKGNKQKIYIYIHGWKHNANIEDKNLEDFKDFLLKEEKNTKVKVTGLYIGWRGKGINNKTLDIFSFFSRKNTSEDIGHGSILEILLKVENLQKDTKSSLVTIGHSLGASVILNAIEPLLVKRFLEFEKNDKEVLRGYGDLVVLYNSAVEATKYKALYSLIENYEEKNGKNSFKKQKYPILISISGDADLVTNNAFEMARHVSTFFESYSKPRDKNKNLDIVTVGNSVEFRTHKIDAIYSISDFNSSKYDLNPEKKPWTCNKRSEIDFTLDYFTKDKGNGKYFENSMIIIERNNKNITARNPYWILYNYRFKGKDASIITGHELLQSDHITCLLSALIYNMNKDKKIEQ